MMYNGSSAFGNKTRRRWSSKERQFRSQWSKWAKNYLLKKFDPSGTTLNKKEPLETQF